PLADQRFVARWRTGGFHHLLSYGNFFGISRFHFMFLHRQGGLTRQRKQASSQALPGWYGRLLVTFENSRGWRSLPLFSQTPAKAGGLCSADGSPTAGCR